MADYSDLEREGVSSAERAFTRHLHWAFRDQSVVDYGIDAHVEPKRDGVSVGKLIALQIKAGGSYFDSKAPDGWYYRGGDRHLRYWRSFVLPVVVILYDPETETCYWQHVAPEHITYTDSEWKLLVPASQTLSADAFEPLMRIAESAPGASEDPLASYFGVLPPSTVVELEAADKARPGGALRMAALLAGGRFEPELIIQSLLAAQPSWWSAGAGRFEMVLATYASEHGYAALAAEALARAVAARDHPTAALYSNAAYFAALAGNRERAETFADLAEESGGAALLCAMARAIAAHEGLAPVEVPQLLKCASAGELAREPAALLFLGESAMARHDYADAVGHLNSAVELLPQSSTAAIGLAYALLGRNASGHSVVTAADFRRVEALAGSALEQRRRWAGPSGEALAVLIGLQILTGAFKTALRMATPRSQGGDALDREAACGLVAVEGAEAALVVGDRTLSAGFASRVAGTWAETVIRALSADPEAPLADRIALWREALAMALPPQVHSLSLSRLAQLGTWPMPEVEELLSSGVIPIIMRDILTAYSEAARSMTDAAVRRVRQHAARNSPAAEVLVDILAGAGRHAEAAEECDRAISRFGRDAVFLHKKLNALALAGDTEQANALATRILGDPAAPREIRIALRRRLATDCSARGDWHGMEEHCAAAIADGYSDPDVQWGVIGARFNQGNLHAAWAGLQDLRPEVDAPGHASLWTILHAKFGFSVEDVSAALGFLARWPDQVLADDIITTFLEAGGVTRPDGQPVLPELDADTLHRVHVEVNSFLARHQGGRVRTINAEPTALAGTIRELATARARNVDAISERIRAGQAPMAMLDGAIGWSYTQILADCTCGFIPAVTPDLAAFNMEISAARSALGGRAVIDLSALAVATSIPGRWPQMVSAFTELQITRMTAADLEQGHRDVTRAHGTAISIGYDPEHDTLTAQETTPQNAQRLARRVSELVDAASYTIVKANPSNTNFPVPVTPVPAWVTALELASQSGVPLWSDDIAIRAIAAQARIPSFGTVALLHVLIEDGILPDTLRADALTLAAARVVDLPLATDDLAQLAAAEAWRPEAAATSMMRPAFWASGEAAVETFLEVIEQIPSLDAPLVEGWLAAACLGLAALVPTADVPDRLADLANRTADRIGADPEARITLLRVAARMAARQQAVDAAAALRNRLRFKSRSP